MREEGEKGIEGEKDGGKVEEGGARKFERQAGGRACNLRVM